MRKQKQHQFEQLESRIYLHGDEHVLADLNDDGVVDTFDIAIVSDNWGSSGPLGDVNGDGRVDVFDINAISEHWTPPDPGPHPDDPAKREEHLALLALVPRDEATSVAVQSGPWSDPATWGGAVPGEGARVLVPVGLTVTVDGEFESSLEWVRVDGALEFAPDRDTLLVVDTMVGDATSQLTIGTAEQPIQSGVSATIRIADRGPIDFAHDPFALSRGLVWHGSASMHGSGEAQSKDLYVTWANGHSKVDKAGDYRLTRNIVIESENPALDRRGHVMFMHNPNIVIDNVVFKNLGRTDKSFVVSDPDGQGNGLENPRARYPVHFHRAGAESHQAVVANSVVWGSPGWGFVNHDSNVLMEGNLTYQAVGAGFISEIGTERGAFVDNVAIDTPGYPGAIDNDRGNKDFGFTGVGFWMQGSGGVEVVGNKSYGARESGYMFMSDAGWNGRVPIIFRNNESYESPKSLTVWANNFFAPFEPPAGQVWSEFTGNKLHGNVFLAYSSYLMFSGNEIIGDGSGLGVGNSGVLNNVHWFDNTFRGWETALLAPTEGWDNRIEANHFEDIRRSDIKVQNTAFNRPRELDIAGNFHSEATWSVDMSVDFYSYNLEPAYNRSPWDNYSPPDWRPLFVTPDFQHDPWTKGNTAIGDASHVRLDGVPLYFAEQGADFEFGKLLVDFPNEIRYGPDGVTLATGASLNARGLYVGGAPIGDEQYHLPKVRGVLVSDPMEVGAQLVLVSERYTTNHAAYVARLRTSNGVEFELPPATLVPGSWNPVEFEFEGTRRAVRVFAIDFATIDATFGGMSPLGDANHDGRVDIFDVNTLSASMSKNKS